MKLDNLRERTIREVKLEREKTIMALKKELYKHIFLENKLRNEYMYYLMEYNAIEFTYLFNKEIKSYKRLRVIFGEKRINMVIPEMLEEVLKAIFPEDRIEVGPKEDNRYFISISFKEEP